MVMKISSVPANDDLQQEQPMLPDSMLNRPDARELRAFLESYQMIEDPASRAQIRKAVSDAVAESE